MHLVLKTSLVISIHCLSISFVIGLNLFDIQLSPHLSLLFVWKLSLVFRWSFWMLNCRLIHLIIVSLKISENKNITFCFVFTLIKDWLFFSRSLLQKNRFKLKSTKKHFSGFYIFSFFRTNFVTSRNIQFPRFTTRVS